MKNILVTILTGILILATTGCAKEKYDLLPGEVQLQSTSYCNDHRMTPDAQTIWHAIVIKAQHDFEFENFDYEETEGMTRNTYPSPPAAEDTFITLVEETLSEALVKYGSETISEIIAARPKVTTQYVWCSATDEYTTLKFVVEPTLPADSDEPTPDE